MSSWKGQAVGDLELVHRIAIGGMAEVWEARHKWSGERVALKLVMGTAASDPGLRQAMMDEIHIGGLLDHPNIVRLHSLMQKGAAVGIEMDLVEGRDLRKLMSAAMKAKADPPPIEGVLSLAHQCASALAYAHEATDAAGNPLGIIHRDISPQNVLVARDGVVKLLDFGIALVRDRVTKTKVGMVKGKLNYMSPEQIMGEPLDVRTDLFALGVVLWESFAMRPLFARPTDDETVKAIIDGEVARLLDLRPAVPEPVALLVHRLLETKRNARPATAREVLEVLDAFPGDAGTLAAWAMPYQELRHKTMALPAVSRPPPQSPASRPDPVPPQPTQTGGAASIANAPPSPPVPPPTGASGARVPSALRASANLAPGSAPSPGGAASGAPSPSITAEASSTTPAGPPRPWAPNGQTPRPQPIPGVGAAPQVGLSGSSGTGRRYPSPARPSLVPLADVVAPPPNGHGSGATELPLRPDLDALTHVGDSNTTGPTSPPTDPAPNAEPLPLPTSALRLPDATADAFDTTSKGLTPDLGEDPFGMSDDDFGAETRLDRVALGRITGPAETGPPVIDDVTIGVPVVSVQRASIAPGSRVRAPSPGALQIAVPPDARIGDAAIANTIVQPTEPSGAFAPTYVRMPDEATHLPLESSTATVGGVFVTVPTIDPAVTGLAEPAPTNGASAERTSGEPTVGLTSPLGPQSPTLQGVTAPALPPGPPVVMTTPVAPSTLGARLPPMRLPPEPPTPLYARGWFLVLLFATVLLGAAWLWVRSAR